jgi:MFS family permease
LPKNREPAVAGDSQPSVLHYRDYRLYLATSFFSSIAAQAQTVAVGWQIYAITHSPLALGLAGLMPFLPILCFLLPAGHLADRYDRRILFFLAMLVSGLVSSLFMALTLHGVRTPLPFYIALLLLGSGRALGWPARQSFLPLLVPQGLFAQAISWNSAAFQTATILGPALGGVLYLLGPAVVYGVCSVTMFAMAVCTLAIRTGGKAKAANGGPTGLRRLVAGVEYVWSNPLLLGGMTLDLFAVLLGGATALLPIYARDILRVGPGGLGLMRAAPALGAASVGLTLGHRPIRQKAGRKMFGCVALFGLATIVFGLSRDFLLSLGALAVVGAADMVSVYVRATVAQLATPDEMRGRVSAVSGMFISGSNELGEFESGLTASWFGTVAAVVIGGIGTLIVVAVGWRLFPEVRDIEDPAEVTPQYFTHRAGDAAQEASTSSR